MEKWNLIIDVERCEGCNNCILSAKDEHTGNEFPGYSAPAPAENADLITISRKVRGTAPVLDTAYLIRLCNHCDDAPCKRVGGDAIRKRDDGIVLIDPVKAKGRRDIAESCPYGAIVWNEELELPQNWIFDAHLLDQEWSEPRVVQSCPTGVFEAVKTSDDDMQRRAADEELEVLLPETGARPRVYYKNLYRYDKCFVAGTVVRSENGVEDCVANASVVLMRGAEELSRTQTDEFGEFKIDRLSADGGAYEVRIAHPKCKPVSVEVQVSDSVYLGAIELEST
ncbi:MAG: 4Fe-4S dicluster domain-containing protein [Pseudomonadota bacterium]